MIDYHKKCNDFAQRNGITFIVGEPKYDKKGNEAKGEYIFPCTLRCGNEKYTFNYKQALQDGKKKPILSDILYNLQTEEVGTFESFCRKKKYKISILEEKKLAKKHYNKACREYEIAKKLFPDDVLKELQKIL